jgi:hypothetical protein
MYRVKRAIQRKKAPHLGGPGLDKVSAYRRASLGPPMIADLANRIGRKDATTIVRLPPQPCPH